MPCDGSLANYDGGRLAHRPQGLMFLISAGRHGHVMPLDDRPHLTAPIPAEAGGEK
jgi:hypothetical protein